MAIWKSFGRVKCSKCGHRFTEEELYSLKDTKWANVKDGADAYYGAGNYMIVAVKDKSRQSFWKAVPIKRSE